MKKIITSDIPHIIALLPQELGSKERFILEHIYKTSTENFVIVDSMKEWIIVNKELEHVDEIIDLSKRSCNQNICPKNCLTNFYL